MGKKMTMITVYDDDDDDDEDEDVHVDDNVW